MIERNLVAEKEGLVGGHRLDRIRGQRVGAALHFLNEVRDPRQTRPPRQRDQPAFDQILLVRGQIQAGSVFQKLTQIRSEEHTSELQSPDHLVCRLLLEKKKSTARTSRPISIYVISCWMYDRAVEPSQTRAQIRRSCTPIRRVCLLAAVRFFRLERIART